MNYERQTIKVVQSRQENDEEYLARLANESAMALEKAFSDVSCESFKTNKEFHDCFHCKLYAAQNVEDFTNLGKKYPEKCEVRLAINQLNSIRNLIVTGKP
ncbi:MAG: hypothetical protein WC365_01360 [Candidatus Babeliales bacterium]|jgi:hypothetical protein